MARKQVIGDARRLHCAGAGIHCRAELGCVGRLNQPDLDPATSGGHDEPFLTRPRLTQPGLVAFNISFTTALRVLDGRARDSRHRWVYPVSDNENALVPLKTLASMIIRTPFVSSPAAPAILGHRAPAYTRLRFAEKLVGAIDPWWLAVTCVSIVTLLLVSGWPGRAGQVSDGLLVGMVVTLGVAVLLYATRQAEAQLTVDQLRAVARRHMLVIQLARRALTCADLELVMQEVTWSVASSLDVEFCAVLESRTHDSALVLRAGFGWPRVSLGLPVLAPIASPPTRPTPPWQHGHRIQSGVSVGVTVGSHTYGVVDVYTTRQRVFSREEVQFVQTVADVLGGAIERSRIDAERHSRC